MELKYGMKYLRDHLKLLDYNVQNADILHAMSYRKGDDSKRPVYPAVEFRAQSNNPLVDGVVQSTDVIHADATTPAAIEPPSPPSRHRGLLHVKVRILDTDRTELESDGMSELTCVGTVTLEVTAETTFADMVSTLTQQGHHINAFVFKSKVWPSENQLRQACVKHGDTMTAIFRDEWDERGVSVQGAKMINKYIYDNPNDELETILRARKEVAEKETETETGSEEKAVRRKAEMENEVSRVKALAKNEVMEAKTAANFAVKQAHTQARKEVLEVKAKTKNLVKQAKSNADKAIMESRKMVMESEEMVRCLKTELKVLSESVTNDLQQRLMDEAAERHLQQRLMAEDLSSSDLTLEALDTLEALVEAKQRQLEAELARLWTSRSRISSEKKRKMERDQDRNREERACVVCLDSLKTTLLLPCSHLCLCSTCAPLVTHCPVCRTPIQDRKAVYF
uniref:RING-type domain-containing protein n=1 Tax=Octactis speculum TaxID=3111310 RepID=A0A7S2DAG0_9STRA